jgi:iron complex transport system ATP-binding protein
VAVADKVLLMFDQAQAAFGPLGEVLSEVNLEALYGIPVRAVPFGGNEREVPAFLPLFRSRRRAGEC